MRDFNILGYTAYLVIALKEFSPIAFEIDL